MFTNINLGDKAKQNNTEVIAIPVRTVSSLRGEGAWGFLGTSWKISIS